ncbi:MAG: hypothetical protein ACHQT9_05150, partial [Candidatus Saccharimonadales bacterium]
MSGNIAKVPGEVTKMATATAMRTAALGGRLAVRLGEGVVQQAQKAQPDYVPPEILEQQAVLRNFENRFGVVGHLLERDGTERQLRDRVASTAYAMVEGGLVDEHTAVEIRPVLPVDALRDPVLNARREAAVDLLKFTLAHDHDVTAIPNSHPIMPSEHEDSPTDKTRTWSVITAELDGFSHQIDETFEDR